jgi:hypothetical protein
VTLSDPVKPEHIPGLSGGKILEGLSFVEHGERWVAILAEGARTFSSGLTRQIEQPPKEWNRESFD